MGIWQWIVDTLRSYPELAIFLALAVGFFVGPKKLAGFSLGNVTATLLAAVAIGQLGIAVPGPIKSTFFLLFLFAVGYGVGPQFFRGLGKEGPKQIAFSLIVLALCLLVPIVCAKVAGLDLGYAVGLYAGSQTISASIGVASDQINRLGLPADQAKAYLDAIPIGYAVTYIFGTIGSAIVLAQIGPEADRRGPACGLRRVREADGWWPGRAGPRRVLGLPSRRGARLPHRCGERPHRQAGARIVPGPAHLRRAHPPWRPAHRCGRRQRAGARRRRDDFGPARRAGGAGRVRRAGGGGQGPARHAGDDGGCVRAQQGSERQDAARDRRPAGDARHLPAQDHAQHGRDPDPAGDRDPARRHPHDRRQHAGTWTRPSPSSAMPTGRSSPPTSPSCPPASSSAG